MKNFLVLKSYGKNQVSVELYNILIHLGRISSMAKQVTPWLLIFPRTVLNSGEQEASRLGAY